MITMVLDHLAADQLATVRVTGQTTAGWVAYIIIGGIAGWLASRFVRGSDSGLLLDIFVGVIGALGTGLVLNFLGIDVENRGYWFTFFIALVGSIVLLAALRTLRKK